jgi:4-diphosphocytidyl-2-C-methyl-D-erythritol kinase
MILFPNAKINLGLHVLSRREDNFHNLETLMHPVGLCDVLEFLASKGTDTHLKTTGISVSGEMEENLVYKAYLLLKDKYKLPPLAIHLHKIIPTGAGLGGGSSDAAFMLKGLNTVFDLKLSISELKEYAAVLGSDCSLFIENLPAIATGRGEILVTSEDYLKNYKIMLFFPGFPVSTKEAYSGISPISDRMRLSYILDNGIESWKQSLTNDFELTVFGKYPSLRELKMELYDAGAVYASMSGSGSAVFGIFEKDIKLHESLQKYLIWKN